MNPTRYTDAEAAFILVARLLEIDGPDAPEWGARGIMAHAEVREWNLVALNACVVDPSLFAPLESAWSALAEERAEYGVYMDAASRQPGA